MINKEVIHIGTRDSQLALWQSKQVQELLTNDHNKAELVLIKTEGDINLIQPLYEIGVQGIFTKTLDAALLDKRIDIAVHSYKDVPTQLAEGLQIAAILKRGNPFDIFVCRNKDAYSDLKNIVNSPLPVDNLPFIIATSSSRRKSQWLNRFPNSNINNLRGNVNTRLQKLQHSNWHGAIFAAAGLERLSIKNLYIIHLDWMLPAPAQGAIVIICREGDKKIINACAALNDFDTERCTHAEKKFLKLLMGGCTAPIGGYAQIVNDNIYFKGNILSTDGSKKITVELMESADKFSVIGQHAAAKIMEEGGKEIYKSFNDKNGVG